MHHVSSFNQVVQIASIVPIFVTVRGEYEDKKNLTFFICVYVSVNKRHKYFKPHARVFLTGFILWFVRRKQRSSGRKQLFPSPWVSRWNKRSLWRRRWRSVWEEQPDKCHTVQVCYLKGLPRRFKNKFGCSVKNPRAKVSILVHQT